MGRSLNARRRRDAMPWQLVQRSTDGRISHRGACYPSHSAAIDAVARWQQAGNGRWEVVDERVLQARADHHRAGGWKFKSWLPADRGRDVQGNRHIPKRRTDCDE